MNETHNEVKRLAENAIENLQERAGDALDYSVGSLNMIEEILAEASEYFTELPEKQINTIVQQVGCYILEVAHRQFGGEYLWHDQLDQPILVVGEPERHIAMGTWSKVRGRLAGDSADNIPFFYEGFAVRAASAPAGTDTLIL